MTLSRGFALFLTVAAAGTLLNASNPADTGVGRLKAISARTNGKGAQLVIEANTPLAYVATRPDPLTVVLDFRNVEAGSVANSVKADAKSPIASVSIEGGESLGAPVSRVRIALSQPVAHHIRSERNTVVVEFDFCVGSNHVAAGRQREGIDFDQLRTVTEEHLVERAEDSRQRLAIPRIEIRLERQLATDEW